MKKLILAFALMLMGISNLQAQYSDGSIKAEKKFGGYKFTQNGLQLSLGQLKSVMEADQQAYAEIKSANTTNTFATIFSTAGGAFLGYPLGTALGGGNPNWTLAGIGAGLIVVSLPIAGKANRKALNAIETYNASLTSSLDKDFKPTFRLGSTANGIGLTMKF